MKFNENRSKGSEDMELTRNSKVNTMILNCDICRGFLRFKRFCTLVCIGESNTASNNVTLCNVTSRT